MTDLGIEPLAEYQAIVWLMAAQSILLCYNLQMPVGTRGHYDSLLALLQIRKEMH